MESTYFNALNESRTEELSEDKGLEISKSKSKRLVTRAKPENTLILDVKQSKASEICFHESFLRQTRGFNNRVPKHIVSLDEKFLRRCLNSIYISAYKAAPCNMSLNLGPSKFAILSDTFNISEIRTRNTYHLPKFVIEFPLKGGTGNNVGPMGMLNLSRHPLFCTFSAVDSDGKISLVDERESFCSDSTSSSGGLSLGSSQKLGNEIVGRGNDKYILEDVPKSFPSTSSTNSTSSDHSTSTFSPSISRGMLQCTWNNGTPHFVFSIDDQRDAYVANLWKVETPNDAGPDYIYLFHLRTEGQKEHKIRGNGSDLVGKMKVSTSSTMSPNNSKVAETVFVMFGNESYVGEVQSSSRSLTSKKGLSEKVIKAFRRQRTTSKVGEMSTIHENDMWDPASLLENHLPPNLELAAIVMKSRLRDHSKKAQVGGWGMKFLQKVASKQLDTLVEESRVRSTGDCSTSMDVIVPAGPHGGPRAQNGGPSGLVERWRSGGQCDCGGWDLGCPLTLLKTRSSNVEILPHVDSQVECKSFELLLQGTKQVVPTFKMVTIRNDLYYIHFESTLSALQSFSIAVAIIHTQTATLHTNNLREVN